MKRIVVFSVIVLLLSVFLTSAEVYKIIKPDSSSKWARGSTKIIKWDKKGDTYPNVKIRLYTSPGNVKAEDISNSTVNNESFEWKIPAGTPLGKYFVRVKTLNNLKWGDGDEFEIVSGSTSQFNLPRDVMKKVNKGPAFKPTKGMFNPVIESYFDVPMGPVRPGTKLLLKGKKFGTQKGKILLKGNFPGGQIELTNVTWGGNENANGFVPQSANGQPNQIVEIILVTSLNFKSNPVKDIVFEGREEKFLVLGDAKVLHCGDDGNFNACNKLSSDGSICTSESVICGYHKNVWGAPENDEGTDSFQITLKNGWVFKSIQKVKWVKTSGDEVLNGPSPGLPVGASTWTTSIDWIVSPNDHVTYQIKVLVEGPIGTNYK